MRKRKNAPSNDSCHNVNNDFIHMTAMLICHTTPLRHRLSSTYLDRLTAMKNTLAANADSSLACTCLIVDIAKAYAGKNEATIDEIHAKMLDFYIQKDLVDKQIPASNSKFKSNEPVFELFVHIIESMAYELNIEKPDPDKVRQF